MSVYAGIDVHRKRSQVAVINEVGEVLVNRNVPNGVEPILSVTGGFPAGTPAAFEAAFGWGWLLELLEGYGFSPHLVHPLQCKAIASARLKNGKVDAVMSIRASRAPAGSQGPQAMAGVHTRQPNPQTPTPHSAGGEAPATARQSRPMPHPA